MSLVRVLVLACACAFLCARAPRAAQRDAERVELRVSEARPGGVVVVDRGAADGLRAGDLVLFHPRDGRLLGGNVLETAERSAVVELHDRSLVLEPGTRAEVLVPRERLAPPPPAEEPPAPLPEQGGGDAAAAEPPQETIAWTNRDEEFRPGDPLLARMRPVRPEERDPLLTARLHVGGSATYTTLDDRSDSFLRAGADVRVENPFGRGGTLHVDLEGNLRTTDLPDQDDEAFTKLRFDRASYADGGTRYEPLRWEAGRFLQRGMVEFGLLDGVEWGWRRRNGDSYGFSLGFLPEPGPDLSTGDDFQVAGYYEWLLDPDRNFTLAGGYQKTLHHGDADRDLLVARMRYAPPQGWNAFATLWVDYYGSTDPVKGTSLDLTQALVVLGRAWSDGAATSLTFTHQKIPEIDRDEFQLLDDGELDDNRDDRLSLSGWVLSGGHRLHSAVGVWSDENEEGGDARLGLDLAGALGEGSHLDLTGFVVAGAFSRSFGGELTWGLPVEGGSWRVYYQFAHHTIEEFENDADDVLQHRLSVGRELRDFWGWRASLQVEGRVFDDEGSATLGFYLQRAY